MAVEIKIEYGSVMVMAVNQDSNIDWPSLIQQIKGQEFIPLISKRVSYEYLFGNRDMVEAWADDIKYPLKDKSNLARVAQYGFVTKKGDKSDFLNFLKNRLFNIAGTGQEANRSISPADLKKSRITFSEVAKDLGYFNFEKEPDNPLFILAQLRLKIYLTTSPHTFLEIALEAAGREPQSRVYCWGEKLGVAHPPKLSKYLRTKEVEPSVEQPLVFHLHGIDTFAESLVLSEDDFFEFLDNVPQDLKDTRERPGCIPDALRLALPSSSLVLLGYNLYDWDFRVAFRGVIAKLEKVSAKPSLLIQFRAGMEDDGEDTERVEESLKEHKRVEEYLEEYVDLYDFKIYWGNVESFTRELRKKGKNSEWFGKNSIMDSSRPSKKKRVVKPTVFVSYSHQDEEEKDTLLTQLDVLKTANIINLWSDDEIGAGADWETEIRQAIEQASVAILLVTANFLSSDLIVREQVALNELKRRVRSNPRRLVVFPVIAKPCAWEKVGWLQDMEVRPKNKRPVWGDGGSHIDEDLAAIAEEIAEICEEGGD